MIERLHALALMAATVYLTTALLGETEPTAWISLGGAAGMLMLAALKILLDQRSRQAEVAARDQLLEEERTDKARALAEERAEKAQLRRERDLLFNTLIAAGVKIPVELTQERTPHA